jgi:hypothetical protein
MFEVIIVGVVLFGVSPLVVGLACNFWRVGQMIVNPKKFRLWHD